MINNNNEQPSLINVITSAINEALANTHTNIIAKVTKVNEFTVNCKPVMSRKIDGRKIDLPEFAEVPIVNFLGGSSSFQMPIAVGDYCTLFISERCFDSWYSGADYQMPLEARIHDYSDAVALIGLHNKANELPIPTVITTRGDAYVNGNYIHDGNYHITGDVFIDGDLVVTGDATIGGISFLNHIHTGDSGGDTGVPK